MGVDQYLPAPILLIDVDVPFGIVGPEVELEVFLESIAWVAFSAIHVRLVEGLLGCILVHLLGFVPPELVERS